MKGFKRIKGFEGYLINPEGKILSLKRKNKHFIKPYVAGNGYLEVTLVKEKGVYKQVGVHRLLAQTFIPNPNNYPVVNHKDGNVLNNLLDNLEWCTESYNKKHSIYKLKRYSTTLPPQKVIVIDKLNNKKYVFESVAKASEFLGINKKFFGDFLNGRYKKPYSIKDYDFIYKGRLIDAKVARYKRK